MKKGSVGAYLLGQVASLAGAGVAMFWSAGRLDWLPAWVVLGMWVFWFAGVDAVVLRGSKDLMHERMAPPKDSKNWDQALVSTLRLVQLARYILAGLDARLGWTSGFPLLLQVIALVVGLAGIALFVRAMASNPFFSLVVRIQEDRGHAVVSSGPYRVIRHPGYAAGMLLFELAISAVLGSWWGVLLGIVCALLLILRTALEDRTLRRELPGYEAYSLKVRQRLFPGIW